MKTAIVTGASSGIGRDLSILLAREGYAIALAARRIDTLENIRRSILSEGGEAEVFRTDLSLIQDAEKLIESVLERFGRIDLLVNNAGYGVYGPIEEVSAEEIHRVFMVNTISPAILISRAVRHMKKNKSGAIVNISSMAIYTPLPWLSLYTATKSSLKTLTDTLRIELKPFGIRVIGVYPGYVETDFHRSVVLTETSKRIGWSNRASRIAPVLSSMRVAEEIVRRLRDPRFNGDIVVGLSYRIFRSLSQHMNWVVSRSLERIYVRRIRELLREEDSVH